MGTGTTQGWTFNGWASNYKETSGSMNAKEKITESTTFYATWKKPEKKYTITFNANGGSGTVSSVSCTIPEVYNGATQATSCEVTLPGNQFTYSGWTFNGWGTSTTSTNGNQNGDKVTLTGNVTYYATWKKAAKTYSISFNKNGGTGTVSSVSCTIPEVYNGATQATSCEVTLPGNQFTYRGCNLHSDRYLQPSGRI